MGAQAHQQQVDRRVVTEPVRRHELAVGVESATVLAPFDVVGEHQEARPVELVAQQIHGRAGIADGVEVAKLRVADRIASADVQRNIVGAGDRAREFARLRRRGMPKAQFREDLLVARHQIEQRLEIT